MGEGRAVLRSDPGRRHTAPASERLAIPKLAGGGDAVGFTDTEISFTVPDIPEPGETYQVTVVRGDGVEVVAEDTLILGGL